MLKQTTILLFALFTLPLFAQVEDELGFIFVKANYLLETGRYDEAAAQYSEIIRIDPDYKDVLLKRAEAKFALGGFRGVKDDVTNFIKRNGITTNAVYMLGVTEAQLGEYQSAVNTLTTAIALFPNDADLYYQRGQANIGLEYDSDACGDWNKAHSMGHRRAQNQINKYCSGVASTSSSSSTTERPRANPKPGKTTKPSHTTDKGSTTRPTLPNRTGEDNEDDEVRSIPQQVEEPEEPKQPYDGSVKEVEVDEDLSLIFKNGIGGRKVLQTPNILILSESEGVVAIDICVNENGKVDSAELNRQESTLDSPSIISLASRKAKEFWFEKSEWPETCGTVLFKIAGR